MVVPHGSEATRSYDVSERALRAARAGVVGLFLLVAAGGTALALLPSDALGRAVPAIASAGESSPALRARLAALQDTLASLTRRDQQLRTYAGLPTSDSMLSSMDAATPAPMASSLSDSSAGPFRRVSLGAVTDVDGLVQRANALAASFAEITDTLHDHLGRLASMPSIMPTAGWLTSHFSASRFHPILHMSRPHEGLDIAAPMGAPIVAPANGVVRLVGRQNGYGNVLEVDHGNGIYTKYAHCSRILVREGQRVTRGQVIANVGSTGLSTGPHLHYEIHVNGRVVDPLSYVLPGAIPD